MVTSDLYRAAVSPQLRRVIGVNRGALDQLADAARSAPSPARPCARCVEPGARRSIVDVRLVIVCWPDQPDRPWRLAGWLYGCRVDVHFDGDIARVRVDEWAIRRGGAEFERDLVALVERATGVRLEVR